MGTCHMILTCFRSADNEARNRRAAKLVEIGDINQIPVQKISDVAANVSVAYDSQIWQNDMVFKDQDDCSKRLVCDLNAMRSGGKVLSEHAAVLGREVGAKRCELSYRRCETPISEMLRMIEVEIEEIELIQKELENEAISIDDINNRLEEEDAEVASLTVDDLTMTTTT